MDKLHDCKEHELPQAFRCPVCGGRGVVPGGFYSNLGISATAAGPERCRSCDGTGVVWRGGKQERAVL